MKSLAYVKKAINKKDIIIVSIKDGKEKYGRWLGKIYYQNGDQWMDLNQELIDKGLAVKYMDNGVEV
jgi:endonuclease YncB( thermonuclease family)